PADFSKMSVQDILTMDNGRLNEFLKSNNYPSKYTAEIIKSELKTGKYQPKAIANYFGDANAALFNTSIIGAELYRSDDSGITWKKMNSYDLDGVYFTYGYYFGEVRVSPTDEDLIYLVGYPVLKSTDGGITYSRLDSIGDVHVDHHAMWIDKTDPEHILLGNDGGLYESYDEGANWRHINNMSVGQFYTVNVDMEKPYNVYGGLQDNGTLAGSSRSVPNRTRKWDRLFGGDGMFVAPDPRNSDIVYVGFQFGNYFKINRATGERERITLQHDIGEPKLRFNWRTPVKLSSHNADIVYMASQKLHRSFDQGENWEAISPDLTKDKPQGNVPYSTISTIGESPLSFSVIYVGTDDGNVQVTRSGGTDWKLVNQGLPQNLWVSSVVASPHNLAQVFVTLNGYRNDDFKTYIYMSDDYGTNWTPLKSNLPEIVANDLIQDPVNPNLLYLGTDHGTYVSMNLGASWELMTSIPNVASYDLIVHPRDNELVVATHGKSMYVADVKPLQKVAGSKSFGIKAFELKPLRYSKNWGEKRLPYLKSSEPSITLKYFLETSAEKVSISIQNEKGETIRTLEGPNGKGYQQMKWDGKVTFPVKKRSKTPVQEVYIPKGKYKIKFDNGAKSDTIDFEVK
ncbi:MAG: FlgD immunoglobulin-like domain containing protein, partial [Bacteroidota bacterium]